MKNAPTKPAQKRTQQQIVQQEFRGPVPPPAVLEGYENILPGAAERILSMAENDAEHQREIEKDALNYQYKENRRGQYFGIIVVALCMIAVMVALFFGYEKAASIIGGTTVVGLVTVFVVGKKMK
jgi:uncharacterized membrane protein